MVFNLQTEIEGLPIRNKGDYRVALKALCALNDEELREVGLCGNERVALALEVFYEDISKTVDIEKAYEGMCRFIALGKIESSGKDEKPLYDWEQDSLLIAGAISEVAGFPIMEREYMHWWSFMSYFNQIGEGAFATVCSIRDKKNRGKRLEKWEQDFYNKNHELIDFKKTLSFDEEELLKDIYGGE